ncbi:MAG: MBOAT family O-acyltransferase, partial [Nevskiales bacterium]
DFWRRWHMTLSRFLRDYLYVPLGGNRKGRARTYINLLLTMLLGGLWHGAGWTFVIWGGLHGLYLVINHGWQTLWRQVRTGPATSGAASRLLARSITFIAVVIAWVFFRAESLPAAISLLASMAGLNGIVLPESWQAAGGLLGTVVQFGDASQHLNGKGLRWLIVLLVVAWLAPNTQELMRRQRPAQPVYPDDLKMPQQARLLWRPTLGWALTITGMALLALSKIGSGQSEFLYFQF